MAVSSSNPHQTTPRPGTPEFEEFVETQGQQAMDRALAMPLVRALFGLLCVAFASLIVMMIVDGIRERDWWGVIRGSLFGLFILGPLMIDSGSVCFFGRSRTPWFRALMRRWHAPSNRK